MHLFKYKKQKANFFFFIWGFKKKFVFIFYCLEKICTIWTSLWESEDKGVFSTKKQRPDYVIQITSFQYQIKDCCYLVFLLSL